MISGLQKSIRSPPSLKKCFFFTLIRRGLKDVPYPFFDHSSIVTRVTLHWRKGRLYESLWLRNGVLGHTPWVHRVLSSQCSRAFSRFPWHKGDTIREVFSCFFSWNCFCHDDRGSAYRSHRTKKKSFLAWTWPLMCFTLFFFKAHQDCSLSVKPNKLMASLIPSIFSVCYIISQEAAQTQIYYMYIRIQMHGWERTKAKKMRPEDGSKSTWAEL